MSSTLIETLFNLLILDIAITLHHTLSTDLPIFMRKLLNRVTDDIDNVLSANVNVGIAVTAFARYSKLTTSGVPQLTLYLDKRVPRYVSPFDVLDFASSSPQQEETRR